MHDYDVIVVGGGNAAFCAALAAQEQGAKVLVLEAAPEDEAGGNSRFTAGSIRVVYNGVDDIKTLVPDLTQAEIDTTDFGTYTQDQFFDDMARVTQYRADPDLVELLVTTQLPDAELDAREGRALHPDLWPAGVQDRRQVQVLGRAHGGSGRRRAGPRRHAHRIGEEARHRDPLPTRALDLICDGDRVEGVRVRHDGQVERNARQGGGARRPAASRPIRNGARAISAPAGISPRCAAPASTPATASAWRSTSARAPAATGRAATPWQWEMNAPEFGDLAVGDQFQKHSYPFAIMVNATGKRFVDEGADFRNYTYAKYGRVILEQPGQFAWQIFDQKVKHLQRDEYRIRQITKVTANTIEELAGKLDGVNAEQFVKTIAE